MSTNTVRMIDADGHVLEQAELELPAEVMEAFLRAIRIDRPFVAGGPGAFGVRR